MTIAGNPLQVLVLQTAVPAYVKQAMEDILDKRLLGDVSVTLFCRALTEESTQFQGIPWISELLAHDEAHGVLGHLRSIRRRKFDVIVVFLTRDPSYWKMKCFAFLCRGRHVLVFNEHLGCFFYTHRLFAGFLWARYREWKLQAKQKLGYALGTPQGMMSEIASPGLAILRPVHLTLKLLIFPLRWIYLLAWSCSMQYKREKYLQRHGHNLKFDADSR
jgi:hypothetical protein